MNYLKKYKVLGVLIFAESIERFAYYFVSFLIPAYMMSNSENGGLGLTQNFSTLTSSYFSFGILLFPLILAPVIDRYFGHLKSALYGGVFLILGYFTAFISEFFFNYMIVLGLILLMLGTSLVKPAFSVLVGKYAGTSYKLQEFSYVLYIIFVSISSILSAYLSAKFLNELLQFKPLFLFSCILMSCYTFILAFVYRKEKNVKVNYCSGFKFKQSNSIMIQSLLFCLLIGVSVSLSGRIFTYPNQISFWLISFLCVFILLILFVAKIKLISKLKYYFIVIFSILIFYVLNNLFLRELGTISPSIPSVFSGFDMLNNFLIFPFCLAFILRYSPPKALATMQALAFFLFSLSTLLVKNFLAQYTFAPSTQLIFLALLTLGIFLSFLKLINSVAKHSYS
ncbi:hypothetical protein QEJ31_11930 [Pigmentibacter sp. JX0631]|uniref:MFS transporter n=1 Tax=Pigmentibacter sp. JX0631 TaxID=2976982 RepID=UPI00246848BC|nr:MFS transporter [Pigmentibacter sp. JX0631]WGL59231.1 hypothetical protein QEJ31_11930 [Pigmentibacter sp. JX0631]